MGLVALAVSGCELVLDGVLGMDRGVYKRGLCEEFDGVLDTIPCAVKFPLEGNYHRERDQYKAPKGKY